MDPRLESLLNRFKPLITFIAVLVVCLLLFFGIFMFVLPSGLRVGLVNVGRGFLGLKPLVDKNRVEKVYFPNINKEEKVAFFEEGTKGQKATPQESTSSLAYLDFLEFVKNMQTQTAESTMGDKWANWDYTKDYVLVRIKAINRENRTMNVMVVLPSNKDFSKSFKDIKVDCPFENSFLMSLKSATPVKAGMDIFNEIKTDVTTFYGYCLDEKCDAIGKVCVVVKRDL